MSTPEQSFSYYCVHGTAPYLICLKCKELARVERREDQNTEVFERLIALLTKVESKL